MLLLLLLLLLFLVYDGIQVLTGSPFSLLSVCIASITTFNSHGDGQLQ